MRIFYSLEADLQKAACVFSLASKAISAFKLYAKNIISLFGHDNLVLKDLIKGLLYLAAAG